MIFIIISIHAPSRERRWSFRTVGERQNFNPRSLAGATLTCRSGFIVSSNFNPRSLAGATVIFTAYVINLLFQSTLPRGSDYMENFQRCKQAISIHAPSRERPVLPLLLLINFVFQSTLPRGSDLSLIRKFMHKVIFQSTLPRGSDYDDRKAWVQEHISIHAPSRERLLPIAVLHLLLSYFNPRSLAGATAV